MFLPFRWRHCSNIISLRSHLISYKLFSGLGQLHLKSLMAYKYNAEYSCKHNACALSKQFLGNKFCNTSIKPYHAKYYISVHNNSFVVIDLKFVLLRKSLYAYIYVCVTNRPPLWSSGQSSWQQIQRSRFDFRCYKIF
jgi:hypothetical protein